MSDLPDISGQQRLGAYLLGRKLGEGGMGVVYLAHDPELQREVAIKVLNVPKNRSERAVQRFIREAQSTAKLNHPNTVTIFQIGREPLPLQAAPRAGVEGAAEQLYLVMEFVEGGSLADYLEREGPMPWREATRAIRDAAAGLAAAHEAGLVHRDIKPSNLMIGRHGQIKVVDFGLARMQSGEGELTVSGMLIGTPAYMSPEQCECKPADGRSDIYSLACTYYALLMGGPPFTADEPLGIVYKHLHEEFPELAGREAPAAVTGILRRAVQKRPEDRFQSAVEMFAALERVLAGEEIKPLVTGHSTVQVTQSIAAQAVGLGGNGGVAKGKNGGGAGRAGAGGAGALPEKGVVKIVNNLPAQLTSFIGRQRERAEAARLVSSTRLLTMTGPGGTGKTRLALQVAADVMEGFVDGVWFVDLASLSDPKLVAKSIAAVVGVRERAGESVMEGLIAAMGTKRAMILLDNCEHLIGGCAAAVESLLRGCANVRIVASSRERLDVPGETVMRVPSLGLPKMDSSAGSQTGFHPVTTLGSSGSRGGEPGQSHWTRTGPESGEAFAGYTAESLKNFEAITLFVDRASAALPEFKLTDENAAAVARICVRLDGIPLAIELAAARVRVMTPQQVAERLGDRFRLLTGGSRTALPRQKTLKALIDWSYELLEEDARKLLRRLTIFAGGWTLEAAERVCAGIEGEGGEADSIESFNVLDLLTGLVDKSLVLCDEQPRKGTGQRYRLLESIRQYGQERLAEHPGEGTALSLRHRKWFIDLAMSSEQYFTGPEQGECLRMLDAEHDNFRLAFEDVTRAGDAADAVNLGAAFWRYWYMRGNLLEGCTRLEAIVRLPMPEELRKSTVMGRLLGGLGLLHFYHGDRPRVRDLYTESLKIARASGERGAIAAALNAMGNLARIEGELESARRYFEESLAIRRELDDRYWVAGLLGNLASVLHDQGNFAGAQANYEQSLAAYRQQGDESGTAYSMYNLAELHVQWGNASVAEPLIEESLRMLERVGDEWGVAYVRDTQARLKLLKGEPGARAIIELGLATLRRLGDKASFAEMTLTLANIKRAEGDLRGALMDLKESLRSQIEGDDKMAVARCLETMALVIEREAADRDSSDADGARRERGRAAQLMGAAETIRRATGSKPWPIDLQEISVAVTRMREKLGEEEFAMAFREGLGRRAMEAVELVQ